MYRNLDTKSESIDLNEQSMKSNIESLKSNIHALNQTLEDLKLTSKQISNIKKLYESIGTDTLFGHGKIIDILECAGSTATSLIAKMSQADIIESVAGHGKGKYKFKQGNSLFGTVFPKWKCCRIHKLILFAN